MNSYLPSSLLASVRCVARLLVFVSAAAVCLPAMPVGARVGVTSAATGDPLGKPPSMNERVLRVGIDIQENELVTTKADDRAHLVFLDGTALTVGQNASVTIDKFIFNPQTGSGELSVNVGKGLFRLVGGRISKSAPITVTTPSATVGIRGGIAIGMVGPDRTTANLLFGYTMTVTSMGVTQTATRPGSQIVSILGSPPAAPTLIPAGGLATALSALEGKGSSGGGLGDADRGARGSGLADYNSGLGLDAEKAKGLRLLEIYLKYGDITNALSTSSSLVIGGGTVPTSNFNPSSSPAAGISGNSSPQGSGNSFILPSSVGGGSLVTPSSTGGGGAVTPPTTGGGSTVPPPVKVGGITVTPPVTGGGSIVTPPVTIPPPPVPPPPVLGGIIIPPPPVLPIANFPPSRDGPGRSYYGPPR